MMPVGGQWRVVGRPCAARMRDCPISANGNRACITFREILPRPVFLMDPKCLVTQDGVGGLGDRELALRHGTESGARTGSGPNGPLPIVASWQVRGLLAVLRVLIFKSAINTTHTHKWRNQSANTLSNKAFQQCKFIALGVILAKSHGRYM